MAVYCVIQKEVNKLLAESAIECVCVVHKHTGGLQPILNIKQFYVK